MPPHVIEVPITATLLDVIDEEYTTARAYCLETYRGFVCTRARHHSRPHVAGTSQNVAIVAWDDMDPELHMDEGL